MKILVIPDTQVRPGVPTDHMAWIGNYIVEKQPDVIVHLGDHWDLPSLSKHEEGKAKTAALRVKSDVEAGNTALLALQKPLRARPKYRPRKVMLRGNHENRKERCLEGVGDVKFEGCIPEFNDKALGWQVVPFLKPIQIGGIHFAHYFYQPLSGKPYGGTCANKLKNIGFSFVMGHVQGLDVATRTLPNGQMQWGMVAGSCTTRTTRVHRRTVTGAGW